MTFKDPRISGVSASSGARNTAMRPSAHTFFAFSDLKHLRSPDLVLVANIVDHSVSA